MTPQGAQRRWQGRCSLVRLQHFGKIGVQPVIPHAGEDFTQFSHHPALPTIEKGDAPAIAIALL
jgi:hypothetical protein